MLRKNFIPNKVITDKLRSYKAAINELGINIKHITKQYANNIAEVSHQKTRQQQRKMRQFKTIRQTQFFLSCRSVIDNPFRQQRHLLKAKHYRYFRDRAMEEWTQATCVHSLEIA